MFTRHQGKTRCCRSSGISWPSFFVQVRTVRTYLGSFSRSFCSSKRAMMFDRRSSVGFGTIFGIVVNIRDLRALMFSPALIEETTFMTPFRTVETQTACIATVRALPRMQCWFASRVCQPLRSFFRQPSAILHNDLSRRYATTLKDQIPPARSSASRAMIVRQSGQLLG